ncbi:hypothetical protein [Sphingopyxis flava]|uniref:Uncharacterized protein n=1 Tax=Sphingopyxis flava TaxID=1507287 RepID=A0A1T5BR75_9SPHN|nr:hypothetical protein [Sphingopyxis flava]SKB49882.1 hypothetical protein SAMN06295937_100785 [Sphingopyxis flava]
MSTYAIAGGYSFTPMRVGVLLTSPRGDEMFFQPGDAAAHLLDTIEALDEIEDDDLRAWLSEIVLGDYFP